MQRGVATRGTVGYAEEGMQRLALNVLRQAVVDLDYFKEREAALSFLRGEGEDNAEGIAHWAATAGVTPAQCKWQVRNEPRRLATRLLMRLRKLPEGHGAIWVGAQEWLALRHDGAIMAGDNGVALWHGFTIFKEQRGKETNAHEAVHTGGFTLPGLGDNTTDDGGTSSQEGKH